MIFPDDTQILLTKLQLHKILCYCYRQGGQAVHDAIHMHMEMFYKNAIDKKACDFVNEIIDNTLLHTKRTYPEGEEPVLKPKLGIVPDEDLINKNLEKLSVKKDGE